jgi:hypothetical protein
MYKNEIIIKINVKIVKYVELIKICNTNRRIVCATIEKSGHTRRGLPGIFTCTGFENCSVFEKELKIYIFYLYSFAYRNVCMV